MRNRLELNVGATNTNAPKVRDFELRAVKNLSAGALGYRVEIDIEATAQAGRDTEQVISEIKTILSSTVLIPFEYGRSGVINVKPVPSQSLGEHRILDGGILTGGRRSGIAVLYLQEIP